MKVAHILILLAAGLVVFKQPAPAQERVQPALASVPAPCLGCERRSVPLALAQAMFLNVGVNRVDLWIGGAEWADVGLADWKNNLRLGWEWDENGFVVNMFLHPLHGATYLNAGRNNGLSFWESVPLAFLGSFVWEYFGESNRPSLNDFFNTSFGGIALGEVFHRVASTTRDNTAQGSRRTLRELAAFPLDPVGSANRLARGEWKKIGPNPVEHDPGAFVFRIGGGARSSQEEGEDDVNHSAPTLVADLYYGDLFEKPFTSAFDVFQLRSQLSPGFGGLSLLSATGRLFGFDLNRPTARNRHIFGINQRFDYNNNPAYKFGAQSVEAGLASRWELGHRYRLRTDLFADAVILAGLDAPNSGTVERNYDFGPGAGLRVFFGLERDGVTYLALRGRSEFIHSVSGAEANHFVDLGGLEAVLPLGRGLGLGLQGLYYNRFSRYSDAPAELREYPEARILLTWTRAIRPASPR